MIDSFAYSSVVGPVVGSGGEVRTYRVAVEVGAGVDVDPFGAEVETVLSDARGWIAGGDVRLQRVPGSAPATFTVFLATPATSQRMCREEWMETQQFTNCRLSDGRVVINLDRWLTAVPDYGAPLPVYRAYVVNHEVGHQLGHGHESCPGARATGARHATADAGAAGLHRQPLALPRRRPLRGPPERRPVTCKGTLLPPDAV